MDQQKSLELASIYEAMEELTNKLEKMGGLNDDKGSNGKRD